MLQNQFTSKISSLIGFILLILIIGFTVFMNLSEKESIKKLESIAFEEKRNNLFDKYALMNLWKLEGIRGEKIAIPKFDEEQRVYIAVSKSISSFSSGFPKDSIYIHYGFIEFKIKNKELNSFKIVERDTSLVLLNRIANSFINYKISSVSILPENGNFTCINFNDSSKIFLIRDNKKVENTYYKEFIKEAKFLNDSTKLYLPSVE